MDEAFSKRLAEIESAFEGTEAALGDPATLSDPSLLAELGKRPTGAPARDALFERGVALERIVVVQRRRLVRHVRHTNGYYCLGRRREQDEHSDRRKSPTRRREVLRARGADASERRYRCRVEPSPKCPRERCA